VPLGFDISRRSRVEDSAPYRSYLVPAVVTFLILPDSADAPSVLVPIAPELMVNLTNCTRVARTTIRYPLETSVVFWWKDESGTYQQSEGRGRDVSDRGAFVLAAACPPVGTSVGLRISVEEFADAAPALRIEVEGRVLRVEQSRTGEGNSGFAVLLLNAIVAGSEVRKYPLAEADREGKGK
jgi:hypothetical protein